MPSICVRKEIHADMSTAIAAPLAPPSNATRQPRSYVSGRSSPWFALPALALLGFFFLAPILYLFSVSLRPGGSMGRIGEGWTHVTYARFFSDAYYASILWDTFLFGALTAAICALLGFPFSYFIARTTSAWRFWKPSLISLA